MNIAEVKNSPTPDLFTTLRIAIVEGDRPAAEMLHTFFRVMGLEPTLIDPENAPVATLRRLAPDVVLLDLDLPDLRALEIAREIDAPILYLSAKEEGAVRKPLNGSFEEMLRIFEAVLDGGTRHGG